MRNMRGEFYDKTEIPQYCFANKTQKTANGVEIKEIKPQKGENNVKTPN